MKLKKKPIIISLIVIVVITALVITGITILNDKNRLNVDEKRWLNENKTNVISLNVVNNSNIFGKNGEGVFYDFINDLKENYDIEINPVTFNDIERNGELSLTHSIDEKDFNTFYDDEFVLVTKASDVITDSNKLNNTKLGIESAYKKYVSEYLNDKNIEFIEADTRENLLKSLDENQEIMGIIVPKILYLDDILKNNYHIVYHFSDIKMHYGLHTDNSAFGNIITKYFNKWQKDNLNEYLNKNELQLFIDNLDVSSQDLDKIKSNTYAYGFVTNEPYEIISGGNFGGINATYLKKFSDLLDIKIDFIKYKNLDKLESAINDKKINIYFDYYNIASNYSDISTTMAVECLVVASHDNNIVINSFDSLKGKTVYVEANTKLHDYLDAIPSIKVKTYNKDKELKKILDSDTLVALDSSKYESYKNSILSNYSVRFNAVLSDTYRLKSNSGDVFNKLLSQYFEILDENQIKYSGLNNYYITKRSGSFFGALAKYILFLLVIFVLVSFITYKKTKKIKVAKKIKKEDKMKFIDQLTSLKNRNYLTENLENWNNNTIYPQAVIVLDLNKLQSINDTLGYEQGDLQIQAVANILVKTQLDNSDVIRTDGNEFLIYLVGYEVKQVTSYIHKLNREFKKLPFEGYGVAIGYSMITDDVKSVEDATNEAVEQVKLQKEEEKHE